MVRLRIDKDTPDHQGRTEHDTFREYLLNPSDKGGIFVRLSIIFCFILLPISVGITALTILAGIGNIGAWFFVFCLAGASISMLGYTGWSYNQQRKLRNETDVGETHLLIRPIRAVKIAFEDGSELNEYESRIQKTVMGLVLSLIVGAFPIRILVFGIIL